MLYDMGSFKMLILSGIPDAQTKKSVSEKKFPCYKNVGTQQQTYVVPFYPFLNITNVCWLTANMG